jgi:hypothetical protein
VLGVSDSTPGGDGELSRELDLDRHSGPGQQLNIGKHTEPGQGLNLGEATAPRQAATVILLRDAAEQLEVLLVKRTPKARFMGGIWVFPGGAVDALDTDGGGDARAAGGGRGCTRRSRGSGALFALDHAS